MSADSYIGKRAHQFFEYRLLNLLPLYRARWLTAYVVDHAVDTAHFVNDAVLDSRKYFVR